MRARSLLLFTLAFTACGGEEEPAAPDAGLFEPDAAPVYPDASPPDAGPPDFGPAPDAGRVLNASTCLPCSMAEPCPGNGVCATAGSESFCVDRCGDDKDSCVPGFACIDIGAMGNPLFTCVPSVASCMAYGVGFGSPCSGDTGLCAPQRRLATQLCQGDENATGYCTDDCENGVCPPGYSCGSGDDGIPVCLAAFAPDAERCGHEARDDERPCRWDGDCPGQDARCVLDRRGQTGVCASSCNSGCAEGTSCKDLANGDRACVPDRCACRARQVPEGTRDLLGDALTAVGLSRCTATFGVHDWAATPPDTLADPFRLSFYDHIHNEPWKGPAWARGLVGDLDAPAKSSDPPARIAARMVEALAQRIDRPVEREEPGTPDPIKPLSAAVAAFIRASGGTPDTAAIDADAADVPMDLQLAMATVIDGATRAYTARRDAFASFSPAFLDGFFEYGPAFIVYRADNNALDVTRAEVRRAVNEDLRSERLYGGAVDLLEAIAVADLARFRRAPVSTTTTATVAPLLFSQLTPAGRIAIGDEKNNLYDPRQNGYAGAWALLVDLGGHDTYLVNAGANATRANAVSVLVDLGGRDRYGYVEVPTDRDGARLPADAGGRYVPRNTPDEGVGPISFSNEARQGAGRAGTGILIDLGGDPDRYRSLRMSQGFAAFGTGVLIDDGGDDVYEAEAAVQGAGVFGIGVMLDLGGSDVRRAYQAAQGFGFARSAGLLYDVAGDDQYLLDVGDPMFGGDPLYKAAQRPAASNASLGQGFGYGRRADTTDRVFMSGGIGVLVDASGRDKYEGSIFAQGGGYWFGTGILADEAGDDSYDGMWYAMGAGAHYSLGFLLDGAGDDTYGGRLPRTNVTIGGGHDYSAAFLIDESGNDTYNASRITLGAGNATGFGFFVDNGGDDRYSAVSLFSMGAAGLLDAENKVAGSPRRKVDLLGVFIDAGGRDTYEAAGMTPADSGDGKTWKRPQTPADGDAVVRALERGVGLDAASGDSTFHARWP